MKIVADYKIPFLKGAFERICQVEYLPGSAINTNHLADAEALIVRTRTRCDEKLLRGSAVKFIASATIGYDHIDTDYCNTHQICWTNAPGCNAGSVKQYVASALAMIILKTNKKIQDLNIGIIGAGHVGSKVQTMTSLLGMQTLINDPPRERNEGAAGFCSLDEILKKADIISLHVPLHRSGIDKTLYLAGNDFFNAIKPGTWLINTSRGEVVDTTALLSALENRRLEGAIVDVWENEPFISPELLARSAIATPHIAGYSADGKANGTTMSVRAISRFFGLGLDQWSPGSIPAVNGMKLSVDCHNRSAEDLFCRLALHTYVIETDSEALKRSAGTFEKQREDYPVRREPEAYSLKLVNPTPSAINVARALGFHLETNTTILI